VTGTLDAHAGEPFCYLTTAGRHSGDPHRIEIWFAAAPDRQTIFMLAGGRDRSDWVRNLGANAVCTVEIGDDVFDGHARMIEGADDEALARTLVFEKYRHDDDLDEWRDASLPVAIDLTPKRPGAGQPPACS
jgi:deazaflavin-dependent oxidoreductase (nitroreductase family)